ncbi:glycosyltransferase [Rhodohalobacter sp. 8-1]|uniref:glycosyltransferase n=1 Tax=Rhodohalobacter sp. 8-1 TaxID=3131972 RepID=UPI0030EE1288
MPSLRGGGAERTLINLLKKVDYDRYDIDLIAVSKLGPYVNQVPDEIDVTFLYKNNFLVRTLGYLHRAFNIEWFFKKKMAQINKKYDVGISFLDSNYTDLLFFTENIDRRIAFVHGSYLTHSNFEKFYKHPEYRERIKKSRYENLDGIYFVSRDAMSDFIELFGEHPNMGVVYNLIDRIAVLRKSQKAHDDFISDTFTFTAVGSLIPIKGFDRLIRASAIAREDGYEFKVKIAGTGIEEKNLLCMIQDYNLEGVIHLVGFLKNPYPLMKESDVFVMSSVSEALPTVLCEAMILGLPTLVTNCSGCRGLVENGEYGMMAEQNDRDLANKMMLYMDQSELKVHYRKKSIERASLFDDDRILQVYYDIFEGKKPVSL